jgi:hypothetical protein
MGTPAILARRDHLAEVAAVHASLPFPASVIRWAEGTAQALGHAAIKDGVMARINGTAGHLIAAASDIEKVAGMVVAARARSSAVGAVIAGTELTRLETELEQVRQALALLSDQLNAAREDRFDAQDAARVVA